LFNVLKGTIKGSLDYFLKPQVGLGKLRKGTIKGGAMVPDDDIE